MLANFRGRILLNFHSLSAYNLLEGLKFLMISPYYPRTNIEIDNKLNQLIKNYCGHFEKLCNFGDSNL